jgi:hypothetical protein
MAKSAQAKGGKNRKHGREKRKRLRSGSSISQYVRGKISFETYWKAVLATPAKVKLRK